jgi:ribonuclease P protein component
MFPKKNRIVTAKDIKNTLYSKFKNRTQYFTITTRKNNNPDSIFKILVIISKKISKRANIRNKIRRRILAIFDQHKFENKLPSNIWLAIQITNPTIIQLTYSELQQIIADNTQPILKK